MSQLNGRVFSRLEQYDALPTELKDEVERLEQHLVTIQSEVFGSHRTMQLKSIYGVRTRELLEKIEAWVKEHGRASNPSGAATTAGTDQTLNQQHQDHGHQYDEGSLASKAHEMTQGTTHETHETHPVTPTPTPAKLNVANYQHAPESHHDHHDHHQTSSYQSHQPHTMVTPIASSVGNFQIAGSATPATAPQTPVPTAQTTGYSDPTAGAHIPHAKQLLDALVLKGFVTPHKEDKPDDVPSATEDLELKDNELLVARANDVTVSSSGSSTTVWDLVDGAVFAGMLKRKAGLLEPLTHGKDTYAMVNMRLRSLTLFASDLGREPVAQMDASTLKVAFDKTHYEHGVKVWSGNDTELLNAPSASESDALVQALLAVGATQDQQPHHGHAMTGATTTAEKLRDEVKQAVSHSDTKHHDQHGLTGDKHHTSLGDKLHSLTGDQHQTADARGSSMAPPADAMENQHHGWDTELKTTQGEHDERTHGEHSAHQYQSSDIQSGNSLTHGEYPSHTTTTQQQPSHPMKTEAQQAFENEDHAKRSDAPRGFSQVHEPTIAP